MASPRARELDRWGRALEKGNEARFFMAVYRHWFRVEWTGLEHLPKRGGALLVSNHSGMMPIDGGIIQYGIEEETGRKTYSLAHHGFWRVPFAGQFLNRIGGVVGHPENAHRLLRDEGAFVVVFPEGEKGPLKSREDRYRLQRFGRGGFVETAMRAGVPIVPIAVMGTEDTTPVLGVLHVAGYRYPITLNALLFGPILGAVAHFPVKIRARVLAAIHFDQPPDEAGYSRSFLMDSAESIRSDLQQALDEMLAQRESVWLG